MSYLRILTENTEWVCPRSGNYLVTCVAGGPGGSSNTTVNLGGTTSFGGYLSASGSWGDGVSNTGGRSGLMGYVLTKYSGFVNELTGSNGGIQRRKPIGYGGGGYGPLPGGVGKINVRIMYIESGESVMCTIGKGGDANGTSAVSAGNPGVITIKYVDDDVVENSKPDGTKKDYNIRIYSNGSLYTTLYCPEGESIVLNVSAPLVKGFSTSSTDQVIAYNLNQSITPTQNMDLYIVYKKEFSIKIYHNGSLYTTLKCVEGSAVSLPTIDNVSGYSTTSGSSTVQYSVGQSLYANSSMNLYSVVKKTYTIRVYHNGSIYNTRTCTEGGSVTLPNISGISGYSTSSDSTNIAYNNGGTISNIQGDINVYSVVIIAGTIVQGRPSNSNLIYPESATITIPSDRTITISGMSNGNSTVYLCSTDYETHVKVNDKYLVSNGLATSGTPYKLWPCYNTWVSTTLQVHAGDVVTIFAGSYEFLKIN